MQPKKSLGQNFLRDDKVLKKIIEAADLKADDFILEIGPGEGVLTRELVKRVSRLVCIEKDDLLAEKLARNFQFSIFNFQSISNGQILNFKNNAAVVVGDILEVNLPEIIEESFHRSLPFRPDIIVGAPPLGKREVEMLSLHKGSLSKREERLSYKVVANIPYYITSPIIRLFLETKYPPSEMILLVQREVAERISASPGQMSILAVAVQYYAQPELLFYVDKKSFWPVPEVDSAVIRIRPFPLPHRQASSPPLSKREGERAFFRIVKAGFSSKRKTLVNNLSASLQLDKKTVEDKIKKVGFGSTARAQELSVEDWKKIVLEFR